MQSNPVNQSGARGLCDGLSAGSPRLCLPTQGPWACGHEQGLLSGLSLGFPPQTGWLAESTGAVPAIKNSHPVPALPPAAHAGQH